MLTERHFHIAISSGGYESALSWDTRLYITQSSKTLAAETMGRREALVQLPVAS